MKNMRMTSLVAAALMGAASFTPAIGLDVLGVVTVNEDSGDQGVADVRTTTGDGARVEVDVLPRSSGADADVTLGGSGSSLDANVDVGGTVDGSATVGGSDSAADVDLGIGRVVEGSATIGGSDSTVGVDLDILPVDGSGGPGAPGGAGGPGGPGAPGGPGMAGPGGGASGSAAGSQLRCVGTDPAQAFSLYQQTSFTGWERASNIQILPIELCPDAKRQLAQFLAGDGNYARLRDAVMSDPLIAAALSRSAYGADSVLAVQHSGAQLTVYVY